SPMSWWRAFESGPAPDGAAGFRNEPAAQDVQAGSDWITVYCRRTAPGAGLTPCNNTVVRISPPRRCPAWSAGGTAPDSRLNTPPTCRDCADKTQGSAFLHHSESHCHHAFRPPEP